MSEEDYEAQLDLYEALLATQLEIERKGQSMPYTSHNGNMFSFLSPEGQLALRLPDEQREAFLEKHNTHLMEQHGAIMKEYVAVPASLLASVEELAPYLASSYAYAKSLPIKAPRRRRDE